MNAFVAPWLPCLCTVLLLCAGEVRAEVLVLDACMQQCSERDMKAIANLREVFQFELGSRYLVASPSAVLEQFSGKAPLSAIQDPRLTTEMLWKHLRVGIEKWNAAHINDIRENEAAANSLSLALDEAMSNPVIAYSDPQLRTWIERAYIGRAICLVRVKRVDDAKKSISNMVLATPEGSILDSYGTDANNVFQLARKDLLDRGVGSLTIHVDDPDVVFYFNANGRPHRGVFAADMMLPGVYQVFMIDEAKRSRVFYLNVPPRGHATLDVVWRRDAQFEAPTNERSRIGFNFPSYAERRFEGEYASYYAKLVPGSLVVVVGRIMWEGKEAMIGGLYGPAETVAHPMGVIIGTDLMSAHELATFLVKTNTPAPHVIRLTAAPWAISSPAAHNDTSQSRWSPTWIFVGGAAAVATGAGLYAIDSDHSRGMTPYALAVGAVGVAAMGVGIGIWLRDTSAPLAHPPVGPVLSVGASHTLVVGWMGAF